MRAAFFRANKSKKRIDVLRETFARLLADDRFIQLLASEGVDTVPRAISRPSSHIMEFQDQNFCVNLRRTALKLLSEDATSRRTRELFHKLTAARREEAAEIIILVNDPSEYFARALVAASPASGLRRQSRKHVYGASPDVLSSMIAEGAYIHQSARQSFAAFGNNALALVTLECFRRRLAHKPAVVSWLEQYDRLAFDVLT